MYQPTTFSYLLRIIKEGLNPEKLPDCYMIRVKPWQALYLKNRIEETIQKGIFARFTATDKYLVVEVERGSVTIKSRARVSSELELYSSAIYYLDKSEDKYAKELENDSVEDDQVMIGKYTKAQYLDDPTHCPYCDGICFITGNLTMEDDNTATQAKECDDCGKKWFDRFKLTDIIEIK